MEREVLSYIVFVFKNGHTNKRIEDIVVLNPIKKYVLYILYITNLFMYKLKKHSCVELLFSSLRIYVIFHKVLYNYNLIISYHNQIIIQLTGYLIIR